MLPDRKVAKNVSVVCKTHFNKMQSHLKPFASKKLILCIASRSFHTDGGATLYIHILVDDS